MSDLLDNISLKKVFIGVAAAVGLVGAIASYNQIEETERGLVYTLGEMSTESTADLVQPGPKFIVPFFQRVQKVEVGQQRQAFESVQTYTKDNQLITAKLDVLFKVPESILVNLYKTNPTWKEQLGSVVYKSFKDSLGGHEAQNVAQNRNSIMNNVTEQTAAEVSKVLGGVTVVTVLMPDFHFEKAFEQSVEAAAAEKAVLERKKTELEQQRVEAEKTVVNAEATAKATRLAADAAAYQTQKSKEAQANGFEEVARAIGKENMGTYLLTEKWKGEVPQVSGSGAGTILDMRSIAPAAVEKPGPR